MSKEVLTLLKVFAFLGCLALGVWWAATVPLGERTLFGHLRAIGHTKESHDLVRGTKDKVADLKNRVASDGDKGGGPRAKAPPAEAAPQENLTAEDRQGMRRLIESSRPHAAK